MEDDLAYENLSVDDLACQEDYRMAIIFNAIRIATQHECHLRGIRLCPKLRELWLEMIEGSDLPDDMWLWVDGDEQRLREKFCEELVGCSFTGADHKGDWLDAHLALRRRIHRPRNNASQLAERIRNATPEQRLAAICWLTCNSGRVKALAIELGHTPWGMFGLGEIVEDDRVEVRTICLWKVFPENTAAWEEAAKKLEEDKCTCLKTFTYIECVRWWFNMLTWLDGKPPTLEAIWVPWSSCMRCQFSVRKSHDEDIKYVPHINEHYPGVLRQFAASFFCTAEFPSHEEHPTQDLAIDIPPGIPNNTPLTVILGGIA